MGARTTSTLISRRGSEGQNDSRGGSARRETGRGARVRSGVREGPAHHQRFARVCVARARALYRETEPLSAPGALADARGPYDRLQEIGALPGVEGASASLLRPVPVGGALRGAQVAPAFIPERNSRRRPGWRCL